MNKILITVFALMMSLSGIALAAHHEDMPDREEIRAAMTDCKHSAGTEGRKAVRACMEEKGFKPPKESHRPCNNKEGKYRDGKEMKGKYKDKDSDEDTLAS